MEIGNAEDLEIIFKNIYSELDKIIVEKTIHLQNKLNNIQEYLLRFDDLKFLEKVNYIEKINEVIEYKIKSTENKENFIKEKIQLINTKLAKAYLSNREVLKSFLSHKDQTKQYKEKINSFKKIFVQIKEKIRELEKCRENLKVVKHEFNSKHLNNNEIENLKIFANRFLDIYKNIGIRLDEVNLFQKSN